MKLSMEKELIKIIKENLPEMQAKEFTSFFEDYSEMKKRVKYLEEMNEKLTDKIVEKEEIISNYEKSVVELSSRERSLKNLESTLKSREKSIADEEFKIEKAYNKLDLTIMKERLENSNHTRDSILDLCKTLFQNREFTHNFYANLSGNVGDQHNCNFKNLGAGVSGSVTKE